MKNFRYFFPNAITALNLLAGSLAIVVVFRGQNEYNAAWLIFMAALFDLLDGLVARAIDAKSEFGVQFDSLADMVSFGLAPAIIFFNWFVLALTQLSEQSTFELVSANLWQSIVLFCSLLFGVAAAIRLARFNVNENGQKEFSGLPSTAAALIIATIWLMLGTTESELVHSILFNIYVVLAVLVILIVLMLSNIKMLSLKFKGFGFTENFVPYLLIILGIVMVILFWVEGMFITMMVYLIVSIGRNFFSTTKKVKDQ